MSAGGSSYAYNGLGNRLSQTVSAVVTDYLLDLQPGLSKVLAATTSGNTTRYVHDPRGLHSQQQSTGDWIFPITDGLNSVRSVVDDTFDVLHSQHYVPYGEPFGESGTSQTDFGFTGEPTDGNGLVHLRARYLNPELGVFPNLDPVEGALQQAMSLNRYGYVAGNVANLLDPSGMICAMATGGILEGCLDLEQALSRSISVGISAPAIRIAAFTPQNTTPQTQDYQRFEQAVEQTFGMTIQLYNSSSFANNNSVQLNDCSSAPSNSNFPGTNETAFTAAMRSLLRVAAALTHIATRFRLANIGYGPERIASYLGQGTTIFVLANEKKIIGSEPNTVGVYTGYVPLSSEVFVGSGVKMYTIVHELGHLLDAKANYVPSDMMIDLRLTSENGTPYYIGSSFVNTSRIVHILNSHGLGGRAATINSSAPKEVWADMFMTWVLDGQNIVAEGGFPATVIEWNSNYAGDNRWVAFFKQEYTELAVERLVMGEEFLDGAEFQVVDTNTEAEIQLILDDRERFLKDNLHYWVEQ